MRVITFASTKGGVGKSTLAALCVDGLLREGDTIRLIDLDPQGTLTKWAEPIAQRSPVLLDGCNGDILMPGEAGPTASSFWAAPIG